MPKVKSVDTVESLLEELGGEIQMYRIVMPIRSEDLHIEAREGMPIDGKRVILWAVSQCGFVWTRRNEWEIEPMPSSRSDAFLKRARYGTLIEALEAARRAKKYVEDKCQELLRRHPDSDRRP